MKRASPTRCTVTRPTWDNVVISSSSVRGGRVDPSAAAGGGAARRLRGRGHDRSCHVPHRGGRDAGERRDADRPQPAGGGQPAAVAGQHAGGEQRAQLHRLDQATAPAGEVVHQVGVGLGELVEVTGDAVAVQRIGLDQAGGQDRATQRDAGREVADRAARDRAEGLVGGLLQVVDPAVGEHGRPHDQRIGVELDGPGEQAVAARGGLAHGVGGRVEGGPGELARLRDRLVAQDLGTEP